jgi:hypothetical protein
MKNHETLTLLLGAGASRSVSYSDNMSLALPLDCDFFEILQKLEPQSHDENAVSQVIKTVLSYSGGPIWQSLERMFYTLHIRARMAEVLFPAGANEFTSAWVIENFTRAITAVLRAAHGKEHCEHHIAILAKMKSQDAVITFNYDLVVERALQKLQSKPSFGPWIYGFPAGSDHERLPIIYKLHGSMNWFYDKGGKGFCCKAAIMG